MSYAYAYDPVGNRLSKTEDGSTTSYQYNAANQMLRAGDITYAYDANGNWIAETGLDGEAQYEYNANNFLVGYTSADGRSKRHGYDGLNRWVYKAEGKSVLESYLYDGLDVLLELAGPKGQHATTYYRANGRIVAQQQFSAAGNNGGYRHRPEGRRLYYTYDALGSVASLSNHKGKSKTRYVYDVFGEVLSGDLADNTYAFTGKRFDVESQTYHFHFRQYDAKVGVWTTPDPIGILGGINVYSYVGNNPINFFDYLGLETEGEYEAEEYSGDYGHNDDSTGLDDSEGWELGEHVSKDWGVIGLADVSIIEGLQTIGLAIAGTIAGFFGGGPAVGVGVVMTPVAAVGVFKVEHGVKELNKEFKKSCD